MARPESIALGGYFPTPEHLIPRLAALIAKPEFPDPEKDRWKNHEVGFVDPCAGTGAAVMGLMAAITPDESRFQLHACELETSRAEAFKKACFHKQQILQADAFRVSFTKKADLGASCLFLNPPYDTDRVFGRTEEKFLDRFTDVLTPGGLLIFLVPHYALAASARTLAEHYEDVRCFRFPDEDFAAFKQVALYAKRCLPRLALDAKIAQDAFDWARDASLLNELPRHGMPLYELPIVNSYDGAFSEWTARIVDTAALRAQFKLWHQTTRNGETAPIETLLPASPIADLMLRKYPLATPPRPAHIAAGIASGLFNGARIEPTTPGFPALLVKGVFDREYRTIEEKLNKDDEVKGLVQIQQPKLVITALNLETHKYSTLASGVEPTGSTEIVSFNAADLLVHYGESLMGVMREQCPVLYDPKRDGASITLADSPRRLYTAQAHASKALVKLLGGPAMKPYDRRGKTAILLGEIGSGKSSVSLMTARSIGSKRILVMCPPHLLTGWRNEIQTVAPDAEIHVASTIDDLETVSKSTAAFSVTLLSREAAKLGHASEGVGEVCPRCGSKNPGGVDFAKKRARCSAQSFRPSDTIAHETHDLTLKLVPYSALSGVLQGRFHEKRAAEKKREFPGLKLGSLDGLIEQLIAIGGERHIQAQKAIVFALLAAGDDARIAWVVRCLLEKSVHSELARKLLLMLPPGHTEQDRILSEYQLPRYTYGENPEKVLRDDIEILRTGGQVEFPKYGDEIRWRDNQLTVDDMSVGSLAAAEEVLRLISPLGKWKRGRECGEFLFQSVPEPRRVALAKHIVKYHRKLFDFMILDEGHEYNSSDSAQGFAAHRLAGLKMPTVLMTGSIMNGYAESLFANMWALSADFRSEFDRDEKQKFIDRFGYRKRLLEDRDGEGKIVEFGSMSDRVTRSERVIGNAPGILPLFLLRHLLPMSVTLHKADLAIDLPACKLEVHEVDPGSELRERFEKLQKKLVDQIKRDRFDEELSGKLFGQLAELPSYLDRATADVGNCASGAFEIRYPESLDSKLVVEQAGFPKNTLLPKEKWMLDTLDRELTAGRNVMVFSWHVALLPRLSRLISEHLFTAAPILYADKVPTAKRQDWITREIVKKGRRVLVTNPVAIQTGLNNLVHFATEIWCENPACNPITYRQAIGRVDRIGQTLETRICFPIYKDTLQKQLYELLMKKVAVSVSTDGLDPESALAAAGLSEDEHLTGLSIGKQIWALIGE